MTAPVARWLAPGDWSEVAGADALRRPYPPRGGEGELAQALARDPRRIAVIVAPPGAGASRLCFELARGASLARYPDPRATSAPERMVDELAEVVAAVPGTERPLVVLDGPSPDAALATLGALASRRIHPHLRVLVPTDLEGASRIPILAGLSRVSLSVAMLDVPSEPLEPAPEEMLPFVLADRAPRGVFPEEGPLRARGLLVEADGGVLARLDARARRALVERLILAAPGGAARLAQLLRAAPSMREGALASLLCWTGGEPRDDLLDALLQGDDPALVDADLLARRAIPASPRVHARLAARAQALLATEADDERAAALLEVLARDAARRGEPALDRLRAALERARSPERRARLLAAVASVTGDDGAWQSAVDAAALASGSTRAEVLARRARALEVQDRPAEAVQSAEAWLREEEGRGSLLGMSAARMQLAALTRARGEADAALEHAQRAREDCRAVGDARGELSALHFMTMVFLDAGRFEDGANLAREALAIAEVIGDAASIGWARYVLGASSDRAADPATARVHYEAAIAAWTEAGQGVPDRVHAALAAARGASLAQDLPAPEGGASGSASPAPEAEPRAGPPAAKPRA